MTLAIYMGRSVAPELAARLMREGLAKDMPVLIGIDVSLPTERLLSTRLDLLGLATAALAEDGPVVLIIGHAVAARPGASPVGHAARRHARKCQRTNAMKPI